MTAQLTGVTSWRPVGIKYEQNEIYIDVVEQVNLLVSATGWILKAKRLYVMLNNPNRNGSESGCRRANTAECEVIWHARMQSLAPFELKCAFD